MTEDNNLVDMMEEGLVEHAGGEHGPADAVVAGSTGALDRVEGLVVGHAEFVDDFTPREAHGRDDGMRYLESCRWREGELPAVPNLGMHHLLEGRCVLFGAPVVPLCKHGPEVDETVPLGDGGAQEGHTGREPLGCAEPGWVMATEGLKKGGRSKLAAGGDNGPWLCRDGPPEIEIKGQEDVVSRSIGPFEPEGGRA
jgi:hypothetical protein